MYNSREAIQKRVLKKKTRLIRQCGTHYPTNPSLKESHERKVSNARDFIHELEKVEAMMATAKKILLASSSEEFDRKYFNSCFRTLEFYGKWCTAAHVSENASDRILLLYVSSVEMI